MPGWIDSYRGAVYPWHCDHVGHMNVMHYVGKFDEATWNVFTALGVTPSWMRDNQRGMAAVSQKIAYRRELHAGDVVTIRSGLLEVKDKSVRFVHEMRNGETGEVAAVTELVGVHLDKTTRRAASLPAEIAERCRSKIVTYDTTGLWT
ncbi:3-hydroxyacyl-CoA dehydrogenase [Magnetospirillum sp. XM-1]|uniref:acyl-CoA thioesterase n=1 Tax=Magnetospirillum sp. XM-1 TaxID=1663591 RepID=UPI00073E021E|nr:thioesterase family protein [Magnetospirillum sp. XM-1]CUW41806.1 3-hydroxyacyl-CoA dehydrogenase [Magnetospirillum sp. XM-1]